MWNQTMQTQVCQCIPCVCLASKPLSPKILPKIKIKKTKDGWTSSPDPQLCEMCDLPFLDSMHICGEKSGRDENRKIPCKKISEDILDLQACSDIVASDLLSDHEKQQALSKNCICLMQIVPLNYDLAKFCFSRSKLFLVKKITLALVWANIWSIFLMKSSTMSCLNTVWF